MISQATKLTRLHNDSWFGDRYDLREEIADTPIDKLTVELQESIREAADAFDQLVETTTQNAELLREVAAEIEQRMQAQAELVRQQEEENELCPVG
jgi:chemotaxis regulatin CheY-phosphate phosphatase CheZ